MTRKPSRSARGLSAWARLLATPHRFRFDAAQRVLMHSARTSDPSQAARFRSQPGLAYSAAEICSVLPAAEGRPAQATIGLMGLLGPAGTLPRVYGETAAAALRGRSAALHDFMDLLAQRMVGSFAAAGIKYRLHRSADMSALAGRPDQVGQMLLALTGHATPGMAERLAFGQEPLLHYAGLFAAHPRSAERLAALVSDWLGKPVEVVQFAGAWLALPPDQRTSLPRAGAPGAWNRLGVDAAIGVRSFDPQARVVLRIGPLDQAAFAALLPDQPGHAKLVGLVRTFLGLETGFALNPVVRASEVPQLRLAPTQRAAPRLGWNTWLAGASRRAEAAADACFEAPST